MATSTAPAVLSALVDLLIARPGLANVQVTSGPMPPAKEKLEFWEITGTQQAVAFGKTLGVPTKAEKFTLTGLVEVVGDSAGETVIRAVRARAYAILAELETCLRENPTLGGLVLWGEFTRGDCRQHVGDQQREAQINFDIRIESRI